MMGTTMSSPGIYEILNTVNGKRYIGQTANFTKRWSRHRCMLRDGKHDNAHLQSAWDKYGADVFVFAELGRCPIAELTRSEQAWMDLLPHEYNKAPAAGSRLGTKMSAAACAKISKALKGKKKSPAHVKAASDARRGQPLSPACAAQAAEHCRRLAAANVGRKYPNRKKATPRALWGSA